MSKIFTYALAVVGLGVILSVPQARRAIATAAQFVGRVRFTLIQAAAKPQEPGYFIATVAA